MKAITLYPEWAWAVCNLGKDIENRRYEPSKGMIGSTIAIHAGLQVAGKSSSVDIRKRAMNEISNMAKKAMWDARYAKDEDRYYFRNVSNGAEVDLDEDDITLGAIVAVAKLDRCDFAHIGYREMDIGTRKERIETRKYSEGWSAPGLYGWALSDIFVLDNPVKCRGNQRIWNLQLETIEAVQCDIDMSMGSQYGE